MNIRGELARVHTDAFVAAETPVVVEGALAGWPALARWTPRYLAERLGDVAIRWKRSDNGAHPNFHAATLAEMFATRAGTFRELVALASTDRDGRVLFSGDEKFVLRRRDGVTTIDPELAPLLDDVRVPPHIPADRLYTIWAWFSGAGARTWLHYDNNGCHNLNAQITGEKTCLLIDPDDVARCALFPIDGPNPAKNCSQIDVAAPDLARFPEFAQVRAYRARLSAGDLLYIPVWWLHAFSHIGAFNCNINFWWKPELVPDNAVARHQAEIERQAARGADHGLSHVTTRPLPSAQVWDAQPERSTFAVTHVHDGDAAHAVGSALQPTTGAAPVAPVTPAAD